MFATIFLGVVIIFVAVYLYQRSHRSLTVPGLQPRTNEEGNLVELSEAGSLHSFLMKLHGQYGSIASFWMGPQYVVSICSPELFKEHQNAFDRPPCLFRLFEPWFGSRSITYANGSDAKNRRMNYDRPLIHQSVKRYYPVIQEVADELVGKWSSFPKEEHIPLDKNMSAYALRVALLTLFGEAFRNEKEIAKFQHHYDMCWAEMARRLTEAPPQPGSREEKDFDDARGEVRKFIKEAVEYRKEHSPVGEADLLLDAMIDHAGSEEELLDDAISYLTAGFHEVLTWGFYFLAKYPETQAKLSEEIQTVLVQENVDAGNNKDLVYLRQVIDETLRCAVVAPWAARFEDVDRTLGGFHIPKNTPVIHALGVSLQNMKYWPSPETSGNVSKACVNNLSVPTVILNNSFLLGVFEPDRFSSRNSKLRPTMAFQPFGFGGKRICPGYKLAYAVASVCFVTLLQKYKFKLVGGQEVKPVHGFVTHPANEIYVTIEKRG